MTTTTTYGTWLNATGTLNVASYIVEALDTYIDGFDLDAIETDFREAISEALPQGVVLAGDEFIGPADTKTRRGTDPKAIVEGIDFWAIVAKHDHGA